MRSSFCAAHDVNQHVAVFFAFDELLGQKRAQTALLGVQAHDVAYALTHNAHVERAAYVVGRAQLVSAQHRFIGIFAGNHDYRDVLDPACANHARKHIEAVHLRHDDVQQHQAYLVAVLLKQGNALDAVFRF